jgi:hypothetical protein
MSVDVGSAYGKIVLDGSGLQNTVQSAVSSLGKLALAGLAIGATVKIIQGGINAVKEYGTAIIGMGIDAQEANSLIATSLGAATSGFAASIDEIATATNRSRNEMAQSVSTTIAMTKAMGFGQEQAAAYAVQVAQAGADLGSFFNQADAQVILDINSALAGSSEPMQKYGIDVRETALQNIALTHGLIEQGQAMDRATRATAVMIAIQEQAADAMGDAERTSASLANQLRGLRGEVVDAGTEIGSKLLPVATEIVTAFRRILPGLLQIGAGIAAILVNIVKVGANFVKSLARAMGVNFDALADSSGSWGENIIVSLASGMAAAASAVISVLTQIGQIISYWLQPGSPPKLLPKLDEWGAGAMTAYMDGWGDGDFSVFDEITNTVEGFLNSLGDQVPEADLIPRIMGARSAVAAAIAQMREVGSVSQEALNGIFQSAGITDAALQNYVSTLFQLQAANDAVVAAQEEVNAVTQQYDDLLAPLNAELAALNRAQQGADAEEELAGIRKRLAEERLTDHEREQLEMEARRIELEQQIRATEDEKAAAVAAAEEKLDAAQSVAEQIQDEVDAQQALVDVNEENNQMITDQLDLLAELEDALDDVGGAAGGAAGKLGKALGELPEMIEGPLAAAGDMGDLFASKFDSVFERVNEKFAPLTGQMEELGETWGKVFTTISNRVSTFYQNVRAKLQPLIDFLRPLGEFLLEHRDTIINIVLGIAAAFGGWTIITTVVGWIGGLVAAVSAVVGFISYWYTVITGIAAAFGGWTVISGIIQFVVAALGGPLTVAIAAISAVVGLLMVAWRENWGGIQEKTAEAWAVIQPLLQAVWQWLSVNVPAAIETLRAWWVDIAWPAITEALSTAWAFISGVFTSIRDWIVNTLVPTVQELWARWTESWNNIQIALTNVWNLIVAVFAEIIRWIEHNIMPWVRFLAELWAEKWKDIQQKLNLAWIFIETIFIAVQTWLQETLKEAFDFLSEKWAEIWDAIKEKLDTVWGLIEPVFLLIKEWAEEKIKDALEKLRDRWNEIISGLMEPINELKERWDALVSAITGFWTWITSHIFEFKIHIPDLPEWAIPGSPIPLHTAWKNFADEMSRMRIAPQFDLTEAVAPGIGGNQTIDQSSSSLVVNFNGRGDRVSDSSDVNTLRAIYGGT